MINGMRTSLYHLMMHILTKNTPTGELDECSIAIESAGRSHFLVQGTLKPLSNAFLAKSNAVINDMRTSSNHFEMLILTKIDATWELDKRSIAIKISATIFHVNRRFRPAGAHLF